MYVLSWLFAALTLALSAAGIAYYKQRFHGIGIWEIVWGCILIVFLPFAWVLGGLSRFRGYVTSLIDVLVPGLFSMVYLAGWVWLANSWDNYHCNRGSGAFYLARCRSMKAALAFNIATFITLALASFAALLHMSRFHKDTGTVVNQPNSLATGAGAGAVAGTAASSSSSLNAGEHPVTSKERPGNATGYPTGAQTAAV
ncbi:hypothetical protein EV182_006489 [Spiromyces aspiralis]|uniref:Uncharacterized protein n=1 Tax=Spiromyces aspiralis TaxID=68401 RepID=A0ACC1H8J2_9FUNG|nr:hypothetical protein EV182_006489 [Spiromyces aspiralis]